MCLGLGLNSASHSGYWANLIDLGHPHHAGFLCGVSNTFATIPGSCHARTRARVYYARTRVPYSSSSSFRTRTPFCDVHSSPTLCHCPWSTKLDFVACCLADVVVTGIVGNLVTGWILDASGSWDMVFIAVSCVDARVRVRVLLGCVCSNESSAWFASAD